MIRLLIVDDEKATRDTLQAKIDWHDMGITQIKTAKNGVDALSVCEHFSPDIMLCDVKMPKMNGIQLGFCIRDRFPHCKIIYLSGYCDKEYLKSAIELQVVSYIEKPLSLDEIKEVVNRTIASIYLEQSLLEQQSSMKEQLRKNQTTIRQTQTRELLSRLPSHQTEDNLCRLFLLEASELHHYHFYVLTLYLVYPPLTPLKKKREYTANLASFLTENASAFTDTIAVSAQLAAYRESSSQITILCCFAKGFRVGARDFALVFHSFCCSILKEDVRSYLCIGPAADSSSESLLASYRISTELVQEIFYHREGYIFEKEHLQASRFYEPAQDKMEELEHTLRRSPVSAIPLLLEMTADIRHHHDMRIPYIRSLYNRLLGTLLDFIKDYDTLSYLNEDKENALWTQMHELPTLHELESFIIHQIEQVTENLCFVKDKKINDIIHYIYNNYTNPQLSVSSIAQDMFLSKTYLCAIFKKETDKTVNEYLTEVRMEKAKQLLKQDYKLYEIAAAVGISDPNYFSSLFKKYAACTPSEYRERG